MCTRRGPRYVKRRMGGAGRRGMMAGMTIRLRFLATLAAATLLPGALAARPGPVLASARLRHCGADLCLLVAGRRADAAAAVSLAGHDVAVQGRHSWHVAVPLATVRAWSAPFARSILVAVAGRDGGQVSAPLPIGLFGATALALLDVSARR